MQLSNEVITSRQNKTLLWVSALTEKKYRDACSCFCIDGYKLFEEAVSSEAQISHVFLMESKAQQYMPNIERYLSGRAYENTLVTIVKDVCFDKITKEKSPQGIITIVKYLDKIKNNIKIYKVEDIFGKDEKIIILSSLRDPSNVGAVLRSAAAFGTKTVLMSSDCADVYQPKVLRAAMGALFRARVLYCDDLVEAVQALRANGRHVYAAELRDGAVPLSDISLCRSDVIVIGNEGHGIAADVSAACDQSVYLPISSTTESLNAAVAASIFLWEMRD